MIDRATFHEWMSVLADRIGRPLHEATQLAYHATLSRDLTTAEFVAAAEIAFRTSTFWPTPEQLVEFVKPRPDIGLQATQAFQRLLKLGEQASGHGTIWRRDTIGNELGLLGLVGFDAIGGNDRLRSIRSEDVTHARREFIVAYRAAALEAEKRDRAETALVAANTRVPALPRRQLTAAAGATP